MPIVVRNVQSLENFPANDGFTSKLLGITALTVVVMLFALNLLRRVPAYLRLFPFFVCASACTNTQQNGRSVNASISNLTPNVELELGAACGANFLPDWPADHSFAVPALPSKKVDFDPLVPGICFDCEDHRWCRSIRDIHPDEPMRSTSEAKVKRDNLVTDRMRRSRSYDPQKSIAFAISRALRLDRYLWPDAPACDVMFWTDDKCVLLSSDVPLTDSKDPEVWKRDWGLQCRSSAKVIYSREDCPDSLIGRPDLLHFGQVPIKQEGRDEWSASCDHSVYTRHHTIPRVPPFHPSSCMGQDTISRWCEWRLTLIDNQPVAVIDRWTDFPVDR